MKILRVIDLVLSTCAIACLAPALLPIALVLRFTGEHEIFYVQRRVGKEGREFALLKFATMLKESPEIGSRSITLKNDPRVLPVGKFLRKSKINELPQLVNIFLGDMSFVGPRPLTGETFSAYDVNTQREIKKVTPGLTGVGSIIFRSEEEILSGGGRSVDFYREVVAPYKGQLEIWYVRNRSVKTYVKCILITAWIVMFPRSEAAWLAFEGLPSPPNELVDLLNYRG